MTLFAPLAPLSLANSPLSRADFSATDLNADPNHLQPSFSQTLQNAFDNVNTLQNKASDLAVSFAAGKTSDVHSVMIAAEQATIALQMTAQVRNKAVDAYQEIMKISM